MGSLLRSVKKREKSRRLGEVEIVSREEYAEFELDAKVEMIRSLVPLGLMRVHELLDDEVKALGGERYARKEEWACGRTITTSGTNLLIEATRRLDEWNMFSSKIPNFDVTPYRVPLAEDSGSIRLTRQDWGILRLADGQRSIKQISESLGIDSFETGRLVFGLLTVGALSLEPEPERREDLFEAVPELMPELASDEPLHLTALQWKVLASIDGRRSMSALANRAGVPTATVVEMVKDMAGLGWVKLDQSTTQTPTIELAIEKDNPTKDRAKLAVEDYLPRIRAIGID